VPRSAAASISAYTTGVDTGPEKRFVRPLATLAIRPRDSEPAESRKAVGHNTLPGMVVADALIADATAAPVRRAGTTPRTLVAPSISKNLPVSSVAATAGHDHTRRQSL